MLPRQAWLLLALAILPTLLVQSVSATHGPPPLVRYMAVAACVHPPAWGHLWGHRRCLSAFWPPPIDGQPSDGPPVPASQHLSTLAGKKTASLALLPLPLPSPAAHHHIVPQICQYGGCLDGCCAHGCGQGCGLQALPVPRPGPQGRGCACRPQGDQHRVQGCCECAERGGGGAWPAYPPTASHLGMGGRAPAPQPHIGMACAPAVAGAHLQPNATGTVAAGEGV